MACRLCRQVWLSFEIFDFEDHLGGDGAFLIEHGIGEGGFGDGADFSGDAEGDLMDGCKGLVIEEGLLGAGEFKVMGDIVFGFFQAEAGHMVAHGDTLVEGFHDGEVHDASKIGLTGRG